MVFEICPRIGLASMRCEGASILRLLVIRESIAEVVILGFVNASCRVIFGWEDIDGRSYSEPLSSVICQKSMKGTKDTYRSSNAQQDGPQATHFPEQESDQGWGEGSALRRYRTPEQVVGGSGRQASSHPRPRTDVF